MRRPTLSSLLTATFLLGGACRTDHALVEQQRVRPPSTPGEIASFALASPTAATLPADGRCDTLWRTLPEMRNVPFQLVSWVSPVAARRITVGVDARGGVAYYNDVQQGTINEWVTVDRRTDEGTAVSFRIADAPRRIHGHAESLLRAEGLGNPARLAQQVLTRCRAMLSAAGAEG